MTIRFWEGGECEGILLALRGLQMRVAVPGSDDTAALYYRGGQWFAENGNPVQVRLHALPSERPSRPN